MEVSFDFSFSRCQDEFLTGMFTRRFIRALIGHIRRQ